jgi:alkylhydroperoxidase/carboxymuconolactone decarboxylase family protein YurZ
VTRIGCGGKTKAVGRAGPWVRIAEIGGALSLVAGVSGKVALDVILMTQTERPGLDRKTRSCITLTALMAPGQLEELALHVRAAVRNGLTEEEIEEVLLQGAIYCGLPAANAAFAVAERVLGDSHDS